MTTKEYLEQIRHINRRIQDKIAEAEMWKQIAIGGKMSGGDAECRVQTSKVYDKMANAVVNYVDYTAESYATARKLAELKYKISKQIDFLPTEIYYTILKSYYVLDMNVADIMDKVGYGKSQFYNLFNSALEEFEKIYGSEYLSSDKIGLNRT